MSILGNILTTGELELWKVHREHNRMTHPLTYLFWEATLQCNYMCKHCGSSTSSNKGENELTTEEVSRVFSEIASDYDPRTIMVAITGGEPLLREDFFTITSHISSLDFPWGLVTNGSLVTPTVARKLRDTGMKTVVVSIDDIGPGHDTFRGVPGAYSKALEAISNLAELHCFNSIQITTTVTRQSVKRLDDMYEAFRELPITSWRIMGVSPIGRAKENPSILLKKTDILRLLSFIKAKRKRSDIPFEVTYGCENYLGIENEGQVRSYFFECQAGINVGSILHNGDIFACPNIPRSVIPIQGNVRTDRFSTIWENKFQPFRDHSKIASPTCKSCKHWGYCEGGSLHLIGNPCFFEMTSS